MQAEALLPLQLRDQRVGLLKLQAARSRWGERTARGSPSVVGFQRFQDVALAVSLPDHAGDSIPHGLHVRSKLHDIVFRRNGPMPRNGDIEI